MKNIEIGNRVVDMITHIEGIALHRIEMLDGTVQFGVQSHSSDKANIPDGWSVDAPQLILKDEALAASRTEPDPGSDLPLGAEYTDKVSGFTGIATRKVTYFNGCVRYLIQPKGKKNQLADSLYFDWKRLEKIGVGVSEESEKPVKRSNTGGPSTRTSAMRHA